MPYPQYHAFRVNDPSKYKKFVSKNLGNGILIKLGITKEGTTEEQAYWFDEDMWTFKEAKKWLKENNIKYIEAEPALKEGERSMEIFELGKLKADKGKQKVLTLPRGKFYIEKYDTYIEFGDKLFNDIINNFKNPKLSKPFIDRNHEYKESYGDIVDMEIGEEGLYTYWTLNNRGIELIKTGTYKYISPSIENVKDLDGNLCRNVLISITLTNVPALLGALPTLQEQIQLSRNKEGGRTMGFELIKTELGLDVNVNESVVLNRVKELKTELEKMKEMKMEMETVLKEKVELEKKLKETEKTLTELNAELQNIKQESLKREAEETIKKAIELGQYHPKLYDLKVEQYMKDKETVKKELEILPKTKDEGRKTKTDKEDTNIQLYDDEREAMLEFGLDPKDKESVKIFRAEFKKNKKE